MSSYRNERGAVHILFLIVVLVVALAGWALWFVQLQESQKLETDLQASQLRQDESETLASFYRDYYAAFGEYIGAGAPSTMPGDRESILRGLSGPEEGAKVANKIKAELSTVSSRIDDASAKPDTLRAAWEPMINAWQNRGTKITEQGTDVERLKSEVAQKEQQVTSLRDSHASELQRLQEEYEQTRSTQDTQLSELRRQNDEVQQQIRDLQNELAKGREEMNAERQRLVTQTRELEGQVRTIHQQQRIKRATQVPDGTVLSVDPVTGQIFIDIGSNDMLRRGTRFKVFEIGKGGERTDKGWVTVIDTRPGMSEARIDEAVPGRRIEAGDRLYNPVYDRKDQVHFVFIGQLPGKYNRETAQRILEKLGANVEDSVDIHTDFVVLGMKEHEDDEELTESENYRNAIRWGVEMIRARDLEPFLQL